MIVSPGPLRASKSATLIKLAPLNANGVPLDAISLAGAVVTGGALSMVNLSVELIVPPRPSLTVNVNVSIGCDPDAAPEIASDMSAE